MYSEIKGDVKGRNLFGVPFLVPALFIKWIPSHIFTMKDCSGR